VTYELDRAEVFSIIHCDTKLEEMPSHFNGSLNGYINSAELLRLINRRTCPPSWRWAIVTRASSRPATSRLVRRARWIDWIFYRVLPQVRYPFTRGPIRNFEIKSVPIKQRRGNFAVDHDDQ